MNYYKQTKDFTIKSLLTKYFCLNKTCKIVPILLIFLLFYNSVGYIVTHISQIAIIKSEMRELVETTSPDSKEFQTLIFSTDEIYGVNPIIDRIDEREFRFKGNMYDIIKEEIEGDRIVFHCILDKKESLLELLFTAKYSNDRNENSPQNIASIFAFKFLPNYIIDAKFSTPDNLQSINYLLASEKINTLVTAEIPTPPPQFS